MSSIAPRLQIPCLDNTEPYYTRTLDRETPPFFDTKTKVVVAVAGFFAIATLVLLPFAPLAAVGCFIAADAAMILMCIFKIVESRQALSRSELEPIEQLEVAQRLGATIEISPEIQRELQDIIPAVDEIREDDRIGSIHYNCDETATFTLKSAPDFQFRICRPEPRFPLVGCFEHCLTRRYENLVYAQAICEREHYDALFVSPIKPIYLQVDGLRRTLLVERRVEKAELSAEDLELAVRQMVRFLLRVGGACPGRSDPLPFTPVKGNRLALQNLHYLTEDPHPDLSTRKRLEEACVIGEKNSLLSSLDREDLIDIALDEFKKLRPSNPQFIFLDEESAVQVQDKSIQEAKDKRMLQIQNAANVDVKPESPVPPNHLDISPEELGLDLALKDYAIIRSDGIYSDGLCRTITLGEVAQAIIDRINQKLEANPQHSFIEFTPEDLLIGETPPLNCHSTAHYHYNMLQGLGYRTWPNPNQEPPYWMALVLEALQRKNLVHNFSMHRRENPQLYLNLEAISRQRNVS